MTREEAIKTIKSAKRFTYDGIYDEAFDMAISALSENKGEWLPVTEETELPEHDVICCNNEGDIALGYLYFDEEENQIVCDRDPYVMLGIVAYMELPEPYKAESIYPNDMACMFEGVAEVPNDAFKGWTAEEMLEKIRAEREEKVNGKIE